MKYKLLDIVQPYEQQSSLERRFWSLTNLLFSVAAAFFAKEGFSITAERLVSDNAAFICIMAEFLNWCINDLLPIVAKWFRW